MNSALKVIGSNAFSGCTRITSLTIPTGATSIEGGAFSGSGITSITIPKSVTSIGSQSWSPEVIYGYSNSTAEDYASDYGYVFYPLDGDGSGDPDDDTTEIQTGNANRGDSSDNSNQNLVVDDGSSGRNNGSNNNNNRNNNGSNGSGSNQNTSGNNSGSNSNSSGTSSNSSNQSSINSGAYASTTSNTHQVDNTPKTGDGFDPKFMVCAALVLIGCAFFFLAKRKSA